MKTKPGFYAKSSDTWNSLASAGLQRIMSIAGKEATVYFMVSRQGNFATVYEGSEIGVTVSRYTLRSQVDDSRACQMAMLALSLNRITAFGAVLFSDKVAVYLPHSNSADYVVLHFPSDKPIPEEKANRPSGAIAAILRGGK